MKDRLLEQAAREYSPERRILGLAIEGVFFLGILPFILIFFSSLIDLRLNLPRLALGLYNSLLGGIILAAGIFIAWWAIYVQFTIGRGTPVPLMATQRLITQKPYSLCRNPMALGAILMYFGAAIALGSISAVVLVMLGAALLLSYIKLLEEKEMESRFGAAYLEYRKTTPFILPRLKK